MCFRKRGARAALAALLCCVTGAVGVACSARTIPAGGLVLLLGTNLRAGTDFDSFRLEISQQTEQDGWNSLIAADFRVPDEAKLPTTFAIAAGSSPDQVALIRFIALKGPQAVVLREAEIQVPTDHVAELKMILATSCYGQVRVDGQGNPQAMCADPSMSCQPETGTCGPTVIDPSSLPPYAQGDEADAGVGLAVGDAGDAGDAAGPSDVLRSPDVSDAFTTGGDATVTPDGSGATEPDGESSDGPAPADGGANNDGAGEASAVDAGCDVDGGYAECSGHCADLSSDKENCGRCGHSCQGGLCFSGTCQPFTVGRDPEGILSFSVANSTIYWLNTAGAILSCPISGCQIASDGGSETTSVAQGPVSFNVGSVAVDSKNVYWTCDNGSGGLLTCPLTGCGTSPTLLANGSEFTGIAVNSTDVYWNDDSVGGGVRRCPLSGCPVAADGGPDPITLAPAPFGAGIAIQGADVYWTTAAGTIAKCPLSGCPTDTDGGVAPFVIAADQMNDPLYLAVDSSKVYWGTGENVGQDLVLWCPLNGCPSFDGGYAPNVLAEGQDGIVGIVVDDTGVYWATGGTGSFEGSVSMCPLAGCPQSGPIPLATGQDGTVAIAIDRDSVYWATGGGSIKRLAK